VSWCSQRKQFPRGSPSPSFQTEARPSRSGYNQFTIQNYKFGTISVEHWYLIYSHIENTSLLIIACALHYTSTILCPALYTQIAQSPLCLHGSCSPRSCSPRHLIILTLLIKLHWQVIPNCANTSAQPLYTPNCPISALFTRLLFTPAFKARDIQSLCLRNQTFLANTFARRNERGRETGADRFPESSSRTGPERISCRRWKRESQGQRTRDKIRLD
jgi:hypothetical protein